MSRRLTALLTATLAAALLMPFPAAAQSGAVKPGQNKVKIRTVADDIRPAEPAVATSGQKTPPAAAKGNSLSDTAKIVILVAVITAVTIVAIKTHEDRVCGPLSGCPLF